MVWGLNVWDVAILAGFLVSILAVGFVVSRTVHREADFYLGGRKLGRLLQFFLNFGNSTDATGAVTISTAVYQKRGERNMGQRISDAVHHAVFLVHPAVVEAGAADDDGGFVRRSI